MGVLDAGRGRSQAMPSSARHERATIDGLLTAAWRAESGALVLAGPPGIGKSTLVQCAIDAAPGSGPSHRRGGVGDGLGIRRRPSAGAADPRRSAPAPGTPTRGDGRRTRKDPARPIDPFLVGLAVLSLVADAATVAAVLVVIDDAQWLDDESAVALSFVGRRLCAVAMVVALRDTPTPRFASNISAGSTLSGSATRALELLAGSARAPVDPTVASRILVQPGQPTGPRRAACRVDRRAASGAAPLPDPLPIGDRLSGLFASRVRVLDADARMVLLLAAAERFGDPVLLRRAAETAGELSWDEAVARAEASGLVTFTPTVEFRHPLVRSRCTTRPPRPIGAALMPPSPARSTPTPTPTVVPGTSAAAAGPDEQVAQALEASAERARRRGGASAAAAYLWRAFELTRAGTRS